MIEVERFLEDLSGRYARSYEEVLLNMAVAIGTGNKIALSAERARLVDIVNDTMGVAEIVGASLSLQEAAKALPADGMAMKADIPYLMAFADAPNQTIIPRVTLDEAIEAMSDRVPMAFRRAADRTAQKIAKLYGKGHPVTGRPIVAFAYSAEMAVTKRVQKLIVEAIREGTHEVDIGRRIVNSVAQMRKLSAPWTQAYARMVFRTNANTAVTAGRFRQAQDPDIKAVTPCFRLTTARDADVRDNHKGADGLVFKVDNPIWDKIAPPLGYNCRCKVRAVSLGQLRRMNRLDSRGNVRESDSAGAVEPDEGFRHGGRPDILMVAAAR